MVAVILFVSMFVFLILQVPVGFALGCASFVSILSGAKLSMNTIPQMLVVGCDSFPIMAIPLFILAGDLMGAGGISKRLLEFFNVFLGRIWGGTAVVTVAVAMFFAAVSGSGPATVAAIGSMVVPTMVEQGYSKKFSLSLVATAGCIGVIIPPSIPMVIFGISTGTSITNLFAGGFGPGVLIGVMLIGWVYYYSRKNKWRGATEPFTVKRMFQAFWNAKWALINPVIILGGIYGGIFTPTEAAAVAAVYAFVCGAFIYRELKLKMLFQVISNSCITTCTVMAILGCATVFTKILTIMRIPELVSSAIMSTTDNRIILLLLINTLLLIVGCFMDTPPAIMVLSPILMPIAVSLGLNPVHFGIIMVVNLAIGYITPPLGVNLFVAVRVGNSSLEEVLRGMIPFIIVMLMCLLLITFIPNISMTIPNLIMRK
jgi:C4-dicarboxylate transporter DctM subunit